MFHFSVNFTDPLMAAMVMKIVFMLALLTCAQITFGQEVRLEIRSL